MLSFSSFAAALFRASWICFKSSPSAVAKKPAKLSNWRPRSMVQARIYTCVHAMEKYAVSSPSGPIFRHFVDSSSSLAHFRSPSLLLSSLPPCCSQARILFGGGREQQGGTIRRGRGRTSGGQDFSRAKSGILLLCDCDLTSFLLGFLVFTRHFAAVTLIYKFPKPESRGNRVPPLTALRAFPLEFSSQTDRDRSSWGVRWGGCGVGVQQKGYAGWI